jgi:hypothetical protein
MSAETGLVKGSSGRAMAFVPSLCCLVLALACTVEPRHVPQPALRGSPSGAAASLVIDSTGGSVTSDDGLLTLTVPAGAIDAAADFTIAPITNTAPGAIGSAYRLGPEGLVFALPLTLVFTVPVGAPSMDQLTIAYQGAGAPTGFWLRLPGVVRDTTAMTLAVAAPHLSDWSVVTANTAQDLFGSVSYAQTIAPPFTASGTAILNYAGEDDSTIYYLSGGTLTLDPFTEGTTTCTANTPSFVEGVSLVQLFKSPLDFSFELNAEWETTCSDSSTSLLGTQFDTFGINLYQCPRGYQGTPVLGPDHLQGVFTIDCGATGTVTASWDLSTCTEGAACGSTNPCAASASIGCGSSTPVCTDRTFLPVGAPCGTGLTCASGGVCAACPQGAACPSANPCAASAAIACTVAGATCVDQTLLPAGAACGVGLTCSSAGACQCAQGAVCSSSNPCAASASIDCATSSPVCTDQTFVPAGTACGTGLECTNAGVCSTCPQGAACASSNPCAATAMIDCATSAPLCTDQTFVAAGTSCGAGLACSSAGACQCEQGAGCTSTNPCAATAAIDCATSSPICTDQTFLAAGTPCGTGLTCSDAGVCGP